MSIKPVVGKSYKDGSGRTVKILCDNGTHPFRFIGEVTTPVAGHGAPVLGSYMEDGSFMNARGLRLGDLVEEIREPVVVYAAVDNKGVAFCSTKEEFIRGKCSNFGYTFVKLVEEGK